MSSVAPSKYLILGNSAAAINAVEAIRALDRSGTVTLIARESEHAYSRPLITYRLAGKVDDAGMDYRARDFYAALSAVGLEWKATEHEVREERLPVTVRLVDVRAQRGS